MFETNSRDAEYIGWATSGGTLAGDLDTWGRNPLSRRNVKVDGVRNASRMIRLRSRPDRRVAEETYEFPSSWQAVAGLYPVIDFVRIDD